MPPSTMNVKEFNNWSSEVSDCPYLICPFIYIQAERNNTLLIPVNISCENIKLKQPTWLSRTLAISR